jgi:4-amino-4-deoxy-L-arabinose transferase-like glycosyltransferase
VLPDLEDRAARRKFLVMLGFIALGALVLRIAYVLAIKHGEAPVGDEPYYHATGDDLAHGFWFVTGRGADAGPAATHPPLTSLVLAVPSLLASGNSIMEQRLLLAILGVLTVVAIGFVGREIAGARAGLIAAAITAVYPALWGYNGVLLSETLGALFVALALLLAYRYVRAPELRTMAWLGLVVGLAALTRGELVLLALVLVLPVVLIAGPPGTRDRLRALGAAAAVALIVVMPWVGWNLTRFERPVFVSLSWSGSLCGANNDRSYHASDQIGMWGPGCPPFEGQNRDQSDVAHFYTSKGFEYIGDHLGRLPVVIPARVGRVWGVFGVGSTVDVTVSEGVPRGVVWAGYAVYLLVLPLAAWGAISLRRRGVRLYPMLAPLVLVTITAIISFGIFRFRMPADVALVVLGGVGVDALLRARSGAESAGTQDERASASSR